MAQLIENLDPERVRAAYAAVRAEVDAAALRAGRDPSAVSILAAVKYVPVGEMGVLAQAGVDLVGENRAQELVAKQAAWPGRFTWDFIGHLQSRKVRLILPHVRLIHSVASESAVEQLARHAAPDCRAQLLIEVNVSGEPGKSGVAPGEVERFLDIAPLPVAGLMTMPPLTGRAQESRPYFRELASIAASLGLRQLSMGTSQDYAVAVEEGATIVRIGTSLYR